MIRLADKQRERVGEPVPEGRVPACRLEGKPVLTMLGVGHSEAIDHWNNNAMITAGDHRLLIDAGYTIKFALRDRGLTLADVDAIFISHVHADHCFGLERLAYECRFRYRSKPILYLAPGIYDELWNQTLQGVMGQCSEGQATLDDFFRVVQLEQEAFDYHGVELTYFQNCHTPGKPSYGLWINEHLLFSGDTRAIPETVARFNPATILHDCTLEDWNPVHASVSELLDSYPSELRQRMYLMSYEDDYEQHRHLIEREFAGFAWQGQEFEL